MNKRTTLDPKIVDFQSAKAVKDFVETASQRIYELEDALYAILDCHRLDVVKEIAAETLGEDIEVYLEVDGALHELDLDRDDNMGLPWDEYDT